MINKFILRIAALHILVLSACSTTHQTSSSKASLPGNWKQTPIVVDGDSRDWPSPYPNYDNKAKVAYATCNDGKNLYITMQTGDEMTQMKILKQGMTVSIDTNGKKDARLSINYPLQNDTEPLDITSQSKDKSRLAGKQSEQKINRLMQDANQFSVDGFSSCNGGYLISQALPCGIKVKARIDEFKELVWEACIPFSILYNKDSITAADAGRPISVCFAVKGFRSNSPKNGGNTTTGTNDGMGVGQNSSMRGGSRQGGMRSSGTDPLQHLYETTKTWKQFGLAVK